MVRLKINPPKRLEPVRPQRKSVSATQTPTTATSASSADDTIEVARKPSGGATNATVPDALIDGIKDVAVTSPERVAAQPVQASEPVETMNGVAAELPQRAQDESDQEVADEDDAVTEYDFTNEEDDISEDDDDSFGGKFIDTEVEVIEISSDDGKPAENFELDKRPWLSMSIPDRAERERMYCLQRNHAMNGDWEYTEQYMHQIDEEMEEYLKDFPLDKWVINPKDARSGYEQMKNRQRLRRVGVEIYQHQIHPQRARQQPQMPVPAQPVPNPFRGLHQMPVSQYSVSQHMPPPPHIMHHSMAYGPPASPYNMQPPTSMQFVGMGANGLPLYQPVPGTIPPQHHQYPQQQQQHSQHMQPPSAPPLSVPIRAPSQTQEPVDETQLKRSATVKQAAVNSGAPKDMGRKRKRATAQAISAEASSDDSAITPPYPAREKPPSPEASVTGKTGKPTKRRVVDSVVFPWNRNIDFVAARAKATWDLSIYPQETLDAMEKVRQKNAKYIKNIDNEDGGKRRQSKIAKELTTPDGPADLEKPKRQRKEAKTGDAGESNSTSNSEVTRFEYAGEDDIIKARALAKSVTSLRESPKVEDIMEATSTGQLDFHDKRLGHINICWYPAKKGLTQDLEPVVFSIRDSMLTREQLANTLALTLDAARCIIDFCPDIVFRDILLRIISESGLGNKDVRNRMCANGIYIDKSSITKRVGSALGRKQGSSTPEEDAYYSQNVADNENYQHFFGNFRSLRKGRNTRGRSTDDALSSDVADSRPVTSESDGSVLVVDKAIVSVIEGMKRRMSAETSSRPSSSSSGVERMMTRPRGKGKQKMQHDGAADESDGEEWYVPAGAKRKGSVDQVSVQSDGVLDSVSD